jgi:hypothetical protein
MEKMMMFRMITAFWNCTQKINCLDVVHCQLFTHLMYSLSITGDSLFMNAFVICKGLGLAPCCRWIVGQIG